MSPYHHINLEQEEDETMDAKSLYNFIMLCLKDDDGISEAAYASLIEYLIEINEPRIVIEINSQCKSANGRRYIPEFPDVRSCEVWLEYENGSEHTVDTFLNMDLSIEEQIRETFEAPNLEVEEGSKLVNFKWTELGI